MSPFFLKSLFQYIQAWLSVSTVGVWYDDRKSYDKFKILCFHSFFAYNLLLRIISLDELENICV